MICGAKSYFDQIQGGETGASPQWAVTGEPTLELVKIINTQRVARILAKVFIAIARRDRCGYTPHDRACSLAKIRGNATHQYL